MAPVAAFQLTKTRTVTELALLVCAVLGATGCSPKVKPFTPSEATGAIAAQSAEVKTERGRAWISLREVVGQTDDPEEPLERKLAFPAVIVVDRTDPKAPLMRIEAMDPLGSTHALMILDHDARLTWVDYDQRRIDHVHGGWHGVPLARLPELLLGFMSVPAGGESSSSGADGFDVRVGGNRYHYLMDWIDPGPRLAVREIVGTLAAKSGPGEQYSVHYSDFLDKDDFYLPREVEIQGFGASQRNAVIEIKVSWRERRWNEPIPMKVFAIPNGPLDEFKRD